jgi:hypothetical protein
MRARERRRFVGATAAGLATAIEGDADENHRLHCENRRPWTV